LAAVERIVGRIQRDRSRYPGLRSFAWLARVGIEIVAGRRGSPGLQLLGQVTWILVAKHGFQLGLRWLHFEIAIVRGTIWIGQRIELGLDRAPLKLVKTVAEFEHVSSKPADSVEHLTEAEVDKLLAALKRNRHGHRDWLIGLLIFRHGLRVSEACDLRWDDLNLPKRQIMARRLKGSTDSTHYLERDEVNGLKLLARQQHAKGKAQAYVFVNERGEPFRRMGIARMIERAGEAAKLPFPIHVLRHSTGYALANRGMDTRRLQHYLGHASITNTVIYTKMSPEPFKDIWRKRR
jgi:type 1 fimbriae regulatory protein FimB/type 1 fimbriae regulatory protein FimE